MSIDRKCTATTKAGAPCNSQAKPGRNTCARHGKAKAAGRTRRTVKRDWKPDFLEAFAECGTIKAACYRAKIGRTVVFDARNTDEAFAQAFDEIEEETTEHMEREAYRRGVEGVDEPVFWQGRESGAIRKYSDTLLIFMLKARRPEKYRDRHSIEHAGEIKHQIAGVDIPADATPQELRETADALRARR